MLELFSCGDTAGAEQKISVRPAETEGFYADQDKAGQHAQRLRQGLGGAM